MSTVPPCAGRWELFDSTDLRDHEAARAYCHDCPFLDVCQQRLEEAETLRLGGVVDGGPHGTWAGQLVGVKYGVDPATRAAEDAAYDVAEARRAHTAWTHWGDKSDWAKTGERVYQRRRAARRRAAA